MVDDSRKAETEQHTVVEPALDEVAVRAMISILSGYVQRFINEEDFRASLRHNSFASLNFVGSGKGSLDTESKVIANLEQAIDTVERAAEESAVGAYELKKASLQLSVITGLNANDLRDGFTSGIRNSNLSACAHLYLGVIYKIQKKERMSAKHILQMFCDSPFSARTVLLPELWEIVFFPHLSHLKVWYNQEADSLENTPSKARKLKLLEKVYNDILDSGTYQFAVYYNDWLTEGVEAPSIPSIQTPSVSVRRISHEEGLNGCSHNPLSPRDPLSPQPMISKKLYEAVFLDRPGAEEVENYTEAANFDGSIACSSNSSVIEDKRTLTYSCEAVKHTDVDSDRGSTSYQEDGATAVEVWGLHRTRSLGDNEKVDNSYMWKETSRSSCMLHALPSATANELTLKRLSESVFKMPQYDKSADPIDSTPLPHFDDAPYPDTSPTKIRFFNEAADLHGNYESFHRGCFSSSIPKDFTCPLTGFLFDDPVTLETGQNFDRTAIIEWFEKGNKTCPVTGSTLECQSVPKTNSILKHIVNSWKSEYSSNLLAFAIEVAETSGEHSKLKDEAAVFILEQLLTVFSKRERVINANHFISLGGLQFLIRRFEYGNLEEKTRVAGMLCCCIEADPGCRFHMAKNIQRMCFVELLQSKKVKSRENAVLLLTELICLNRRKDVKLFLSGFQKEGIGNTMHTLLVYLRSCTVELKPLVAVLLLHLDLLLQVEPPKYSIYREEAVDALTVALESSLSNEKVREKCCKALLMLGARFSFSGKIMTEDWALKQAGFLQGPEPDIQEDKLPVVENFPLDNDEEHERKEWLMNLSISLLGDGKKSFLETVSKCLGCCDNLDLVRVCLATLMWFSSALASLPNTDLQLFAFSVLISPLKECLENDSRIEHRILASMSLLNFSKIPGCRVLLMTIVEEISDHLRCLGEVTWTAKEL